MRYRQHRRQIMAYTFGIMKEIFLRTVIINNPDYTFEMGQISTACHEYNIFWQTVVLLENSKKL